MQSIIDIYNDRINEIEHFYKALQELYNQQQNSEDNFTFYSDDFLKILKSNALIMVYNLVESTIMGGILEIYDEVKSQGLSYIDVRAEIQQIWFAYMFNQVYDRNAHYNSYRNKAAEIIDSILNGNTLVLDRRATDISGNLDAEKIFRICNEHGITYSISSDCRGGVVLTDVKNKRNDLAHGTTSFIECGRNYSVDDLIKIKEETVSFLKGILAGMENYYNGKKFIHFII